MIDRTFDGLKYKRTYVGGSKKREEEIFNEVQSDDATGRECDWIGFRNVIIKKYDDYLNVIFTWRHFFKNLSYAFGIITLILGFYYFKNSMGSGYLWLVGISLFLTIVFQLVFLFYHHKQEVEIRNYDFALTITDMEIEEKMGLKLKKNPHL